MFYQTFEHSFIGDNELDENRLALVSVAVHEIVTSVHDRKYTEVIFPQK